MVASKWMFQSDVIKAIKQCTIGGQHYDTASAKSKPSIIHSSDTVWDTMSPLFDQQLLRINYKPECNYHLFDSG